MTKGTSMFLKELGSPASLHSDPDPHQLSGFSLSGLPTMWQVAHMVTSLP